MHAHNPREDRELSKIHTTQPRSPWQRGRLAAHRLCACHISVRPSACGCLCFAWAETRRFFICSTIRSIVLLHSLLSERSRTRVGRAGRLRMPAGGVLSSTLRCSLSLFHSFVWCPHQVKFLLFVRQTWTKAMDRAHHCGIFGCSRGRTKAGFHTQRPFIL